MPMPLEHDSEWIPLKRYSLFEFGTSIDQYTGGIQSLFRVDLPSKTGFSTDVRACYRSEDLNCYVETVHGLVHQIRVTEACLFCGFNLIGSKVAAVFSLLGVTNVSKHFPDPGDPLEWVGAIPGLGFQFQVMCGTDTVVEVTLRPRLDEYLQRERSARRYLGGLVDALQRRSASEFDSPIYELG